MTCWERRASHEAASFGKYRCLAVMDNTMFREIKRIISNCQTRWWRCAQNHSFIFRGAVCENNKVSAKGLESGQRLVFAPARCISKLLFVFYSLLSGKAHHCGDACPAVASQRQQLQLGLLLLVLIILILRDKRFRLYLSSNKRSTENSGTWAGLGHNTP